MTIRLETLALGVFLALALSYDTRLPWLAYDAFALLCLGYFLKHAKGWPQALVLGILAWFLASAVATGQFIALLSVWDNAKHLFVAFTLFRLQELYWWTPRGQTYWHRLGLILPALFLLSALIVFYQWRAGYHFDDVGGIFGHGGTHALAYLCLFYLVYRIYVLNSFSLATLGVIVLSLAMAYAAENAGYYGLLGILLFMRKPVAVAAIALVGLLGVWALQVEEEEIGITHPEVGSLSGRYATLFAFDRERLNARGPVMAYAWEVGGQGGLGPGSASKIYDKEGWLLGELDTTSIHISATSGLLLEYGRIGLLLWMLAYVLILWHRVPWQGIALFLLLFFHAQILMDERIVFQAILLLGCLQLRHLSLVKYRGEIRAIKSNSTILPGRYSHTRSS